MPPALILGAIHGDEPAGEVFIQLLVSWINKHSSQLALQPGCAIPAVNPDGRAAGTRGNANGVDLNRNFPTNNWTTATDDPQNWGGPSPASEPETLAVINLIEKYSPRIIVSIHEITGGRECNNYDGPAEHIAQAMGRHNGYPVQGHIGYATPGSFGTWAGVEKGIPVVTLEVPAGISAETIWPVNRDALLCVLCSS